MNMILPLSRGAISVYVCVSLFLIPVSGFSQIAGVSPASQKIGLLNRDPRLKQKVTVQQTALPVRALLQSLSRETGVALNAEPRVSAGRITAQLTQRPVREVMDVIAVIEQTVWEKKGQGYVLRDAVRKSGRPHNSARQALNTAGLEFADWVNKAFSPADKKRLADTENGYPYSFDSLPPKMQSAVRRILEAEFAREEIEDPSRERLRPVQPNSLAGCKIQFEQRRHEDGSSSYSIGIGNDKGGGTMSFDDEDRVLKSYERSVSGPLIYRPDDQAISREEAAKNPLAAQTVSLTARHIKLANALNRLMQQVAPVDYAYIATYATLETRDIDLPQASLSDALDEVTSLYPYHTWELRPSGILVVRLRKESEGLGPERTKFTWDAENNRFITEQIKK